MKKKIFAMFLSIVMMLSLLPMTAFAAADPAISATYSKSAKTVTITVNGETKSITDVNNNSTVTAEVNGWKVTVDAKNDVATIKSKEQVAPVAAIAEEAVGTVVASNITNSFKMEQTWNKTTYHCGYEQGGPRVTPTEYSGTPTLDVTKLKNNTKIWLNLEEIPGTTKWKLISVEIDGVTYTDPICPICGSKEWVSFSNNSGVPDGKNMQLCHPKATPNVDKYGSLTIQKTVGGVNFDEWAADNGFTPEEILKIMDGMQFTAYLLTGENGARTNVSFPGTMLDSGLIDFGQDTLPTGWYEVVEAVSGTATSYFVGEGGTKVYYVGEEGVSAEEVDIVSGRPGVGTIISHDGTGVNWVLPNVWNDQLGNKPYFDELRDMGAQWIWDDEDTYKYGITGSLVKFSFAVDVAEEVIAPIIFAADNAAVIYVNGELAAYTEVAFENREILMKISEDVTAEDFFNSLDSEKFDGRWEEGWAHVYKKDITLPQGENTITIFAANSASAGNLDENGNFVKGTTGTDNDGYNLTNNPCGVIFGFQLPGATFDNTSLIDRYAAVSFNKEASDGADVTQFAFDLFKYNEETDEYNIRVPYEELDSENNPILGDGYYYAEGSGLVYAGDLTVGKYVFIEEECDYAPRGYAYGLYFEITRENGNYVTTWGVANGEDVDALGNPIVVNEPLYGKLNVTAEVTAQHEEITYEPVYEDLWTENKTSTLVSKSNHNLGTLNGQQVFVAVDIAAASTADGIRFEVADSSPSNIGIGYYYNVKIVGNQIVVTFENVKKADVGIMAANGKSGLANGHPNGKNGTAQGNLTRENNTLSVDLPANSNEVVYLFVHIAGGIEWYTGEKKVVGHEEVGRETITDTYSGTLTVTLKDAEGDVVDKTINNNGSVTFEGLVPGEYTCILSGEGFENKEETVTIDAGETANCGFAVTVTNTLVEIGKEPPIDTIIPAPTATRVRIAPAFYFVLDEEIIMELVPLGAPVITEVEPVVTETVETETVETETEESDTVDEDDSAVVEETDAIIPNEEPEAE